MDQLLSLDDGGTALLREMFTLFVEDMPPRFEGLRQACLRGDWDQVAETAHAVKGAAATLGVPRVRDVALALEQGGRRNHWPDPPETLLERLDATYREAVAHLQAFLEERG